MKRSDADAATPRLALPSWRISREATLTELCTGFVDRSRAEGLSPATERYYRQVCTQWLRFCERRALTDPRAVSPDHLSEYASWLQAAGNSKHSVATWLRGVRALMSWAELRGYIELSPFRMWKLKQPRLPAQRGFSAADVRRMIDIAGQQPLNALRDTAILLLLFHTGVRCGEVCRLRLADVIDGDQWRPRSPFTARATSTAESRCTRRRSELSSSTWSMSGHRTSALRQPSLRAAPSSGEGGIHLRRAG